MNCVRQPIPGGAVLLSIAVVAFIAPRTGMQCTMTVLMRSPSLMLSALS